METTYYPFEVPGGPTLPSRAALCTWIAAADTEIIQAGVAAARAGNYLDNHHLWLALATHVDNPDVREAILKGLWLLFHDLVELAMKAEAEAVWDIVVQHTTQPVQDFATMWPQTLDLVLETVVRIPKLQVLPGARPPITPPTTVPAGQYRHHRTGEILRLVDRFGDGKQACTCPKCGTTAPANTFGWRMSRQGPKGRKYFLKRQHSWCKSCRTTEARVYRAAKKLKTENRP